ncbi:MAG: methyltransferase domain-containing protein [Actinobacteria bacterium]|nr:methyltransferase domain-containing protein [Actinomycetota bacterium]
MEVFHEEASIPANSCLLLADRAEAEGFQRGSMRLSFCRGCGFVANTRFDPSLAEYSSRYEETQAFSQRFVDFAAGLAKRWVDKYDLHGKDVLEIGCGKGEFLTLMVEHGAGRGTGIDPGVNAERAEGSADRITWIADFYSERYSHLAADAVVCRHTLEHIQPVGEFMRSVRRAIGERTDTVVLFELPDVLRVLREVAFWDVYYEHCSYFSAGSLARLFRATGFEVLDLALDYDDQYLLIEARPSSGQPDGPRFDLEDDLGALSEAVDHFGSAYPDKLREWKADLDRLRAGGAKAVIWGSGSKGVAYLNGLGADDLIEYAVDINPFKHGMYMAGTGQRIVAPEFLREYRPEMVIAMNPVYVDEIQRDLDALGVDARLVAV